jgi:hypothetical protein
MSSRKPSQPITPAHEWRAQSQRDRASRAELLTLPSGVTILAVRPDPLEWIISGRIPQALLSAAMRREGGAPGEEHASPGRQEILDLAAFATRLVRASILKPAIGETPGEISLDEIPFSDRAFIFQWACRALDAPAGSPASGGNSTQEEPASEKLARFCEK